VTTYRPGDVIQFYQNAKGGFTKGERLTVVDPAAVPLRHAAKFSLYRPEAVALAEHDKIRFTGTVKTLDGKHTLRNGATRAISEITPGGNLRLDNGWVVGKDAGHFRHGYVETSFGAQGSTTKRAILAMSAQSLPATNQEQLYVSASRAKEWMRLYTDDKAAVRQAVQSSSRKLAALDLRRMEPEPVRGWWNRLRSLEDRRRRLDYCDRVGAAWGSPAGRTPTPPRPPHPRIDLERVREKERIYGHEG